MIWLVLGSSPTAPYALRLAREEHKIDALITTNAGIVLEPNPDYYFLSDTNACHMWGEAAKCAAARGTRCVTLLRMEAAMKARGVDWFPEIVSHGLPQWEPFQLSGTFCMEYAAKHGATTVLLCGLEGYDPSGKKSDYFREDVRSAEKVTHVDLTEKCIRPRARCLVSKYPAVQWICYGNPHYTVESDQWIVRGL